MYMIMLCLCYTYLLSLQPSFLHLLFLCKLLHHSYSSLTYVVLYSKCHVYVNKFYFGDISSNKFALFSPIILMCFYQVSLFCSPKFLDSWYIIVYFHGIRWSSEDGIGRYWNHSSSWAKNWKAVSQPHWAVTISFCKECLPVDFSPLFFFCVFIV